MKALTSWLCNHSHRLEKSNPLIATTPHKKKSQNHNIIPELRTKSFHQPPTPPSFPRQKTAPRKIFSASFTSFQPEKHTSTICIIYIFIWKCAACLISNRFPSGWFSCCSRNQSKSERRTPGSLNGNGTHNLEPETEPKRSACHIQHLTEFCFYSRKSSLIFAPRKIRHCFAGCTLGRRYEREF